MISVIEALNFIEKKSKTIGSELISTNDAINYVLAEAVFSPFDMPLFDQSAMDGYAVNFAASQKDFTLVGEITAGENSDLELILGQACRIFTGAATPKGANAVIKQEDVERKENQIFSNHSPKENENIRLSGEQLRKGEKAISKGVLLNPAGIGFLCNMGIKKVKIYKKPKISIIATGNELIALGQPLQKGQKYDSNTFMLAAALRQYGYFDFEIVRVKDDYETTEKAIKTALEAADFLILSGGISVGDYDFVKKALLANGVEEIFHKIKQKPGKPLFFGKKENKIIFGLPGNPASALVDFYIYALKSLDLVAGKSNAGLKMTKKKLIGNHHKPAGKAQFMKAIIKGDEVELLKGQGSAMLHTFALANGLAYFPENIEEIKEAEFVDVFEL